MSSTLLARIHARSPLPVVMATLFSIFLWTSLPAQSVDYGALERLFKEPVTTSVDGSPQRVSDVPATMEIISAEDIRRSGAKDIPGVLRHVGGLDTLEWGNDNMDISIRGYNQAMSPRLLVMVDGRQVYADNFGYTPWSTVPVELSMIRQIEIIKGPQSALFGFNAAGGVINIITKSALYDEVNTASATGGTQALGTASLMATHRFGTRAAARLSAEGYLDSDFSTPVPASENVIPRTRAYRDVINLSSVLRLSSKTQLDIDASQSTAEDTEMGPAYQINVGRYSSASVKANLTAESRFGLLHGSGYTNWLKETSTPSLAGGGTFHYNNRVIVAQFDDTFRAGAQHTFRAALEYRRNMALSTSTSGANVHYSNYAASGMWSWKITSAIALTNALRIDHLELGRDGYLPPGYPFTNADWNRTFTVPSFNSALLVKPSDTDSLRFMVSRGTQLQNLGLSGAYLVVTPYLKISGTPFINPLFVTNYEIGWDHVLAGPHLLSRVSAFHQSNQGVQAIGGGYIPTATGPYLTGSNIGNSTANGLELGFKGTLPSHFGWSIAYRPEEITDHFLPFAQNAAAYTDFQHTNPRHLLKANLGWANDRWEVDGFLQYQSANQGLQPNATGTRTIFIPVPAFAAIDGRLAYKLNQRITWSVSGQNLTHASQVQTSGPAVERRVLGTMTFNF
jgi:outer membrane receptor for ferrienterochelin and colicins